MLRRRPRMEIALAHIDSTDKLPDGPEQFYYQAGGYVLLRIVRDGDTFAVMTATASEDRPYKPYVFEPPSDRSPLFPDGLPAFPAGPAPEPLHPRVFPDTDRLLAAAAPVLDLLARPVQASYDRWERPYLVVRGITDAFRIRAAGNDLATVLGLETMKEPWEVEAFQSLYDELAIDDSGEDVYLEKGLTLSKSGRFHVK
jgi:hypothetical protein